MAYIDRSALSKEYPYQGTFYVRNDAGAGDDGDLFGEGSEHEEDVVILETDCDVTETSRAFASGAITASYDVYFPLRDVDSVAVDRGQMFKCDVNGINVIGMVISVGYSQLGGVHAYIKSSEV